MKKTLLQFAPVQRSLSRSDSATITRLWKAARALCRLLLLALPALLAAQTNQPAPPNAASAKLETLQVQGNLYMIAGSGANIAVQIGRDGVLLVDSSYGAVSDKVLAEVKKLSNKPIRYVINTSSDLDHVDGNVKMRAAGATIAGGNVAGDLGAGAAEGAAIISTENALHRMSAPTGKAAALPSAGWPTSTFFSDQKKLYFDDEGIEIVHTPNAHTDGDLFVFFRKSDVIATGDLLLTTHYPVIDIERGGSINGYLAALQQLVDRVIPVYGQDGGTLLVSGHGRICDFGDLLDYREMTTIIRDRIQDSIKKGMTLEQVKASKPTFDYDPLYGKAPGWGTDQFVEAVYKSLKGAK